jgi:hypothetical protein
MRLVMGVWMLHRRDFPMTRGGADATTNYPCVVYRHDRLAYTTHQFLDQQKQNKQHLHRPLPNTFINVTSA